jgi:hypothetical protein
MMRARFYRFSLDVRASDYDDVTEVGDTIGLRSYLNLSEGRQGCLRTPQMKERKEKS